MGRGRGKGKKQSVIANLEDPGNVDEDNLPIYRRRGRPQKPLNNGTEEEVTENMKEDGENVKNITASIDKSTQAVIESGRKRKSSLVSGEKIELVADENGIQEKSGAGDSTKSAGFRKINSKRKSKPHRAAEAGVNPMPKGRGATSSSSLLEVKRSECTTNMCISDCT